MEKERITRMALGRTIFGNRKGGRPAKESRMRIVLNLLSREYWGWGEALERCEKDKKYTMNLYQPLPVLTLAFFRIPSLYSVEF